MNKISSVNEALALLKLNVLVSKPQGQDPLFFMLSTNGTIIVTNETRKYNISIDDFKYSSLLLYKQPVFVHFYVFFFTVLPL